MGLLVLIITGAIIGWLASVVLRTEDQQGVFFNIALGVAGALVAALAVGGTTIVDGFSVNALLVSFLGAIAFVVIARVFRRGRAL